MDLTLHDGLRPRRQLTKVVPAHPPRTRSRAAWTSQAGSATARSSGIPSPVCPVTFAHCHPNGPGNNEYVTAPPETGKQRPACQRIADGAWLWLTATNHNGTATGSRNLLPQPPTAGRGAGVRSPDVDRCGRLAVRNSRRAGRVAAVVTAAAVVLTLAGPVTAAPPEMDTFHDEFSFVDPDFCGAGLEVRFDGVADGKFKAMARGRDGPIYFMEHVHVTETLTNLANDRTVRDESRTVSKDLRVTDNGDGTLTVLVLATGTFTLYARDGTAIARDPGQVRFELLVDHGGTPGDP